MSRPDIIKLSACSGFSLLEVLVASTVFSLGLAGLAALLLTSINGSAQARRESVAVVAAANLAEQIRMNPVALNRYLNPVGNISKICMGINNCTPEQQADHDFSLWQIELANAIESASGQVCHDSTPTDGTKNDARCDGAGPLVIKIFWSGTGHPTDPEGQKHRFILELT